MGIKMFKNVPLPNLGTKTPKISDFENSNDCWFLFQSTIF